MLCHQCGSPVDAGDASCPNCGAELKTRKRLELSESSPGIRISQQLKAIKIDDQMFPPGEDVAGRFVLGELIGKGPFGEVYKATDNEIDAEVAVKVFQSTVLSSPLDEEAFINATRAARSMTQPNVVRIHGSGVHKKHPWVSMQHLEGLNLRKVLNLRKAKNETFQLGELEPIVSQITMALQHVGRDFPHGDLKPENIIFLPDLLKVTDAFLLTALPAEAVIPRLEDSPYFAPELHTEKAEPDERADVYSLGMIIGEMIFGPDHTPGTHHDGALGAVDTLVKRATAFDPKERYPSVEALSEDLSTVIDTGALLGGESAGPKAPPPPPPPGTSPPKPAPGRPDPDSGAPPAPPPGPAPADPEEKIETVEYDRELDSQLQDAILTEEVGRGKKPSSQRTLTAAAPKPGSRPEPRGSSGGIGGLIAFVIVVLILAGFVVVWNLPDGEDVEQIGQNPDEVEEVERPAGDEKAGEEGVVATSSEADAGVASEEFATATSVANETVGDATGKAVVAVASKEAPAADGQTNGATGEGGQKSENPEELAKKRGDKRPDKSGSQGTREKPKGGKSEQPAGTSCPKGMALVKSKKRGNYCIDRYEYPGGGATPKTRVSWFEAKKQCSSKGKRLCEHAEWRMACGGKYPYGNKWDPDKCNTADEDGFERSLAKTGSFKKCRSRRSGAYDMVGNAHEWVAEQRIAGGGFESDEEVGSCRYSSPKSPASSAAYIGFRCCANPE